MNAITSPKFEEKKTNTENTDTSKTPQKYIYNYNFELKYDILLPIIKDIQMLSQLIQYIKKYQMSDLIFISGNSTYMIDSRFYFNYRKMIDFYIKVTNYEEKENILKIKYHIYKTKPISKNFFIELSLINEEKGAKIEIEIFPPKDILIISEKILNLIYTEFDNNFLCLSLAIKLQKDKLIKFESSFVNNEFFVLSKIIQNIKLIEYLLGCKMTKMNNSTKDINSEYDKYIHLNDVMKISLNKTKKDVNFNDIYFKIINLKSKDDKIILKSKILSEKEFNDKNDTNNNSSNNFISICIFKLTNNSCFLLHKIILDSKCEQNKENLFIKVMKKFMDKIEKLSELSKNQNLL